jgi:acyl-CoA thioester hydrolase
MSSDAVSEIRVRVRYAETDQMGVAHHAQYLVWCEHARIEHLRRAGASYRDLEEQGLHLAVAKAQIRYAAPARFDDELRIHCWVRKLGSRLVVFGYHIDRPADATGIATASVTLIALDRDLKVTHLPVAVRDFLVAIPDPFKLSL